MKSIFLLLFLPALAAGQNLSDVLKQGEAVFNRTCANGYCHGAQGAGGGAPRIAARDFEQTFINNTVTRGIPNTAMQSFSNTLSRAELTAVVAYVARLNGVANPTIVSSAPAPPAAPALAADAARGRDLFSEAVRSFGRCSTCHEVNSIGIPVAAPIVNVPTNVAALKALGTPRVSTVTAAGETMPALVLSNKSVAVLFYDLTTPPPVLRTESPAAVQTSAGSNWRHASVIGAYNDAELSAILAYLQAALKQ
jgi:mono/diheme cytochrome c family protein